MPFAGQSVSYSCIFACSVDAARAAACRRGTISAAALGSLGLASMEAAVPSCLLLLKHCRNAFAMQ
jgi:hypothetical protein